MRATRMCNLAVAATLCTCPMWAQSTAGGGQAGSGSSQGSMQQSTPGRANSQSPMNQQAGMGNGSGSSQMGGPSMDKAFVKKAIAGSTAEVQMGQLALQKSQNEQVKQFAQKMVDDHGKMIDQMKPAAEQLGVKVSDHPAGSEQKKMDKLKGMSGAAFDQAYMKEMVSDHKKDDKDFKQEAQSTQSPQLKQLVTEGDQTIQGHLQMAEQISQQLGTSQKAKM